MSLADGGWLITVTPQVLPLYADGLDRFMQFALCGMQMLFCLYAMSLHVIVVGGAGAVQLVDGFLHVVVDRIQVMPVMNPIGNGDPGSERQTYGKNSNDKRLHGFS